MTSLPKAFKGHLGINLGQSHCSDPAHPVRCGALVSQRSSGNVTNVFLGQWMVSTLTGQPIREHPCGFRSWVKSGLDGGQPILPTGYE